MAARGIYCSAAVDLAYFDHGSALFGPSASTVDFAFCGWHRIHNHITVETNLESYQGISVRGSIAGGSGGARFVTDSSDNINSPYQMLANGTGNTGSPANVNAQIQALDACWFQGISYNHTTGFWTFFYALDGDSSVTANTGVGSTTIDDQRYIQFGGCRDIGTPAVCDSDMTNGKAWTRAFNATEMLAEMKSEAPVIGTNLYGWWKLPSASDLTDSSGNGRTLTAAGTVIDGSLDPVDIRSAARRRVIVVSG